MSEKKFNPFHQQNVENYNAEALEDIAKIKEKMGGINYISTDALMKGLSIDNGIHGREKWRPSDKKYTMIRQEL